MQTDYDGLYTVVKTLALVSLLLSPLLYVSLLLKRLPSVDVGEPKRYRTNSMPNQYPTNDLDEQVREKLERVPIVRHIRDIMRDKSRDMSESNKRHESMTTHRPRAIWEKKCKLCGNDGYVRSVKFGITTITCLKCRAEHDPPLEKEAAQAAWKKDRGAADTLTCIEKGKCYDCGGALFRDYDDKKDATGETLNCRDCGKSYYNAF